MDALDELLAKAEAGIADASAWIARLPREGCYTAPAWQMHMRQRDLVAARDALLRAVDGCRRAERLLVARLNRTPKETPTPC